MKKRLLSLWLTVLILLLGACASSPDREQIEREVQAAYNPLDADYMATVNRNARRSGARVIWVNPPRQSDSKD
jgi:starvation-inducible outer membrane lipoprotein